VEIDKNQSFSAQLPRNLAANIAYFLASVLIGILLVPFFINTLGVAAYGLIPLATSITGYVAIVVQSLNTAVSRFLTVDLRREDYAAANQTFNTAFFGLTAIILLTIPVVIAVSLLIPEIFSVPAGEETGVSLLFLGVCCSLLLRSWSGNFTVQLFAYNRLDLQNLVNLVNLVVQTVLIVLFFWLMGPDLALVGGAYLIGAIVASIVSIVLAKQVCPYLTVSFRSFDRSRIRDLIGMGGWLVIDRIGTQLFWQIDLIVVNLFFGAVLAGEYAIALQWKILLQAIAGTLSSILVPTILAYYALKQTETLVTITKSAVKLMGLAMALPVGLICGLSPLLLTIWVGAEFASLAPLMVLLTANLVITTSVQPLFAVNVAHNKVRLPGIMTLVLGAANLALAIIIPLVTGWGYYGVAVAGMLVYTFRNAFFFPWYAAKLLNVRMAIYLKPLAVGALAVLFIGCAAAGIDAVLSLPPILTVIVASTSITVAYGVAVLVIGLTPFEKNLFISYLPQGWRKYLGNF
jgi:O-antigen/teichoic acid export membrane protein